MIAKRVGLAVFLLLAASVADAQAPTHEADRTATRPNAGGDPELITLRLGLLDIVEIDDRQQVFTVDIFIEASWLDSRLAVSGDAAPNLRTVPLGEIWNPRLTVVNSRGLDGLLPEVATVDGEGNVVVRQRLVGPLAVDLDLREFPFDSQRLPIVVVSYQYSPEEMVFSDSSDLVVNLDKLGGDGWDFAGSAAEPFVYRIQDGGRGASGITFALSAERNPEYFVLTLALPMTLIIFLAWMVHWLPVDVIPARMGTASATVFSLIAFGVSFRLTLPKIAYLTDADRFVLYSTLLVLVSLAVTIVGVRLVGADKKGTAERLSRRAQLVFPVLYALIIAMTFTP